MCRTVIRFQADDWRRARLRLYPERTMSINSASERFAEGRLGSGRALGEQRRVECGAIRPDLRGCERRINLRPRRIRERVGIGEIIVVRIFP